VKIEQAFRQFQTIIDTIESLDTEAIPSHVAKAEQLYGEARRIAGQIMAYYHGQMGLCEARAEQAYAEGFAIAKAEGKSDKVAEMEGRGRRALWQAKAAKHEARKLKWRAVYESYENVINGLKDTLKVMQAEQRGDAV
jgi:hypothetical protein